MANTYLLFLSLLFCCTYGANLEDKKGPMEDKVLDVPEDTVVPYAIFHFMSEEDGVSSYRLNGETEGKIRVSSDGWLYLAEPLQWSPGKKYDLTIEALSADGDTLEGPSLVTLQVVDMNNNAPVFTQIQYSGSIRELLPAGVPFVQVSATDSDDPDTPNAQLRYSIESQIPNPTNTLLFTINSKNGEISTTEEGAAFLRARSGVVYSRGETRGNFDVLKRKFNEFCSPKEDALIENNPFFTCVQHAGVNILYTSTYLGYTDLHIHENLQVENRHLTAADPDYTLIVRVEDLEGREPNVLSTTTRVNIVITQNLWVNPGPINIMENKMADYPHLIALMQSNEPTAHYRLVQKEKQIPFPFSITEDGEIFVSEPLDREQKDMFILVVLAEDEHGNEVDPPMEIQVVVGDENDNSPLCIQAESVFEVQEDELVGSIVGNLLVHDADKENTINSMLSYTIMSQTPAIPSSGMFSIDLTKGRIQVVKHNFRRKDVPEYHMKIQVTDGVHSTECDVRIKIIDRNNEIPIFEKNDYGRFSVPELAEQGTSLLTIKATDADEPGTGSSRVEYVISNGDPDKLFAIEYDENTGEGRIYIAQPLDYEVQSVYNLQIDARNPEPLIKGVEYDNRSTAVVTIQLIDVDEPPVFEVDILHVNLPENITVGSTILTADAKDPEGHKIMFRMEGDEHGWLELDTESGELKTKADLDREVVNHINVRIIAYETDGLKQEKQNEVSIQLMDVNDNIPKLQQSQGFICVQKLTPVMLSAVDADAPPFGEPFTFTLHSSRKSPNWEIKPVDSTSAELVLKKKPSTDQTIIVPINIKDNAGMGITQKIEVRVCNCTELGYCYTEPGNHAWKLGVSTTVGIFGGIFGFIILLLIIVIYRINKKDKKNTNLPDGETNAML